MKSRGLESERHLNTTEESGRFVEVEPGVMIDKRKPIDPIVTNGRISPMWLKTRLRDVLSFSDKMKDLADQDVQRIMAKRP